MQSLQPAGTLQGPRTQAAHARKFYYDADEEDLAVASGDYDAAYV